MAIRSKPTLAQASFPTTRWSLVGRAGAGGGSDLETLLKRYLAALRAYLVIERRFSPDAADDLLQGFTAARILEQNLLSRADEGRGRFRTFLLAALKNYATDEARAASARKRRPERGDALPLEEAIAVAAPARSADCFDVEWARQTLADALRRVRDECATNGRSELWELLRLRVIEPALHDAPPVSYGELIARFNFRTPAQASNALITAKRMFARALRATIADYVDDAAEVDREIADLYAVLSSGRCGDDPGYAAMPARETL